MAAALALLLVGLFAWARSSCLFAWDVYGGRGWDLGAFPSREAAERAALKKLSVEIAHCQGQENYRIYWTSQNTADAVQSGAIWYQPRRKAIGNEVDPGSGYSGDVYTADDAAIRRLAASGGTLRDLPKAR